MKVNPTIKIILVAMLASTGVLRAQGDLLDFLDAESEPVPQYALATFKGTKIINTQSVALPAEGELQFLIQHRFGTINQGAYELWGLDQASIRLGLDYGVTEWLAVGVGRSSFQKTYDGSVKVRLLRQQTGLKEIPLNLTYFTGLAINGLKWEDPERENYFSSRMSYVHQLLIARKFGSRLSIQLTPTFVHRNLVATSARGNDDYALGFGGRYKINSRVSINWDYYALAKNEVTEESLRNSLSIGVDIETGGHVFQLHATNSQGMFERSFITETVGQWSEGDIYFGFNISRVFSLKN